MSARQRRRPWVMQATALYDYDPEESDELALIEGQRVCVLQVQDDGWWLGYAADNPERVGLFPSNYVKQENEPLSPQQQQRGTAQSREADDEEDGDGEELDDERQQHQRRTHQQDQRQQQRHYQPQQHNKSYRNDVHRDEDALNGEEEGEEEEKEDEKEAVEPVAPAQQRMASVLQLKRSLADAERASDAARAARLQAERERIQQQRRRPLPRKERGVEDNDEDEDDEEQEQNQAEGFRDARQQRRHAALDENDQDDDDDDEDAFQYNQKRTLDEEDDDNDDQEQDEEEEEEQSVDNEAGDDGSFSVPAIHESRMKDVISAYQAQQENDDQMEAVAASKIAREYRKHRVHQRSKQQQRSFVERQNAAALAIQRWMLCTSSRQRMRNQSVDSDDRDARYRQEQNKDLEEAAAARIQSWMRQLLAHFRWKEHVERERVTMLRRKRVKTLQLEQEARRKVEEEQRRQQEREEQERQREEQEREELERYQKQAQQTQQQQQAASNLHQGELLAVEKAHKKIMKKEAVELVKILVKKQLDEKLREHDEKMGELQRLVTTLQDIVRKQSEMILQGSNEPLPELQLPRKGAKPIQSFGNQQRQQSSIPAPSLKQPMQTSSFSSPLASSSASTFVTAAGAKESFIPKPPSRSSLPQIGSNPTVKPVKSSGTKSPQNLTDASTTKLPILANARQPSSIPVKR